MKLLRLCKATADCRPGTGSRALPPSCARYRRGCMWPSAPETGVENRPAQSTRCCRRHCHRTQARYCCTSSTASRRSPSLPHIPCVWHLFHLHSDLKQFFYYCGGAQNIHKKHTQKTRRGGAQNIHKKLQYLLLLLQLTSVSPFTVASGSHP